jgi:hypothetical protein
MSTKTTKTNLTEKKPGRLQNRIERLQIIKEAAERHRIKSLWYDEKPRHVSGR